MSHSPAKSLDGHVLDGDVPAVTFAGDTHGDADWCSTVTKQAAREGASWVIQCGDFGWWPRHLTRSKRPSTEHLTRRIEAACRKYGIKGWVFIDGNHDDHHSLGALVAEHGAESPIQVSEMIFYAPRGSTFRLGDISYGALGGAVSLDAHLEATGAECFGGPAYQPGIDWFPEREAPSVEDLDRLSARGSIDVLVTHECPGQVQLGSKNGYRLDQALHQLGLAPRLLIDQALTDTRARLLVHGHWHLRHSHTLELPHGTVQVEGLASNVLGQGRSPKSWLTVPSDQI